MNKALRNCGYLDWVLTKGAAPPQPYECTENGDLLVTLPYVKGLSEEFCRIFKDHGCQLQIWQHPPAAAGVPQISCQERRDLWCGLQD